MALLRALELSLKGSSGIHWITCLPATPGERQPVWLKTASGPIELWSVLPTLHWHNWVGFPRSKTSENRRDNRKI